MRNASLELSFPPGGPASLARVLSRLAVAVESFGERQRWSPALVYRVNLVLDELVSNVVSHGGRPGALAPQLTIVISPTCTVVSIDVIDDGLPFDPCRRRPVPPLVVDGFLRVGGLGLHLVHELSASLVYSRIEGRNHLRLTIRRL